MRYCQCNFNRQFDYPSILPYRFHPALRKVGDCHPFLFCLFHILALSFHKLINWFRQLIAVFTVMKSLSNNKMKKTLFFPYGVFL